MSEKTSGMEAETALICINVRHEAVEVDDVAATDLVAEIVALENERRRLKQYQQNRFSSPAWAAQHRGQP